jgi:hypothetical protein
MRRKSLFVIVGALACVPQQLAAHKPVTSKYTYEQDVAPIIRAKCAACHRPGGAAPMSLLTYADAYPWAESIHVELIANHMPPAPADPSFAAIQHNRVLTAREADVLLTWATGGTPRGTPSETPTLETAPTNWPLGPPDRVVTLPEPVTMAADKSEDTREFTVKAGTTSEWIRAVDVLPGNAAIVRNVSVFAKIGSHPSDDLPSEALLCRWTPGQIPTDVSTEHTAFFLPRDTDLLVRIRYRKTWQYDGRSMTDQTAIGFYYAKGTAQQLRALSLDSPEPLDATRDETYAVDVDHTLKAIALRVDDLPPNLTVQIESIGGDGAHIPMVRFSDRPGWERRYWFAQPIPLEKGSRIEIHTTGHDPALIADAFGGIDKIDAASTPSRLHMELDVVARQ